MNMHRGLIKLALVAGGALSAALTHAADPAPEIPKTRLELWLPAGSVEPAGVVVTRLDDLRGNGNNARRDPPAAAPDANPALAKDPVSGQPILRFTGADIAFAFNQLTNVRTAFWVVSKDPAAFGHKSEKFVLGDKTSNDFHAGWTDDTIFNTDVNPGHLSPYLHDAQTWLNGQPIVAYHTPFPKTLSLITIISSGPVKAGQLARDRNFSGRSWQGDIAEVLLYDTPLADADRLAVEHYLTAKYALGTAPVADVMATGAPEDQLR